MKTNLARIISFLTAVIVSTSSLYIFGYLDYVISYPVQFFIPEIKTILFNIFIFTTMTGSVYYIIFRLLELKVSKSWMVIIACTVGLISPWIIGNLTSYRGVGLGYILIGDYLRDTLGINWYYMDWAGYSVTAILYLSSIISALTLFLIEILYKGLLGVSTKQQR